MTKGEAIKYLNEFIVLKKISNITEEKAIECFKLAVEALEQEQQPRWIPCSERLPERDESVLAYHRNVSFDYQYVSWIDDYSGKWAGFCGSLSDEVLAWMPLPEGYKEEKESEE